MDLEKGKTITIDGVKEQPNDDVTVSTVSLRRT
jgi:hypothetical protein